MIPAAMTPAAGTLDHFFVAIFALLYPLLGYVNFRRLEQRVRQGAAVPRRGIYTSTIAGHWLLASVGLVLWTRSGRSAESLGLSFGIGPGYLPALLIFAAGIYFLIHQLRRAQTADREHLQAVERAFGSIGILLPRNRRELEVFNVVGVTAGIVEELLWRGFLMAYLTQYLSLSAAALVATAGFGIAHAYQGLQAVPKTTIAGAVFMALFLLTGSLWLAIVLHAAVDVLQGRMAWVVIRRLRSAGVH